MENVRIQLEDFSVDQEIQAAKSVSSSMGGVVTFLGCAREFTQTRQVAEIQFDAYMAMALPEMQRLRQQAVSRFELLEVRLIHRIGCVQAGDNIVLIVAGATHRAPAFAAAEWLIDQLKQCVPIWKKEVGPDGENWVNASP